MKAYVVYDRKSGKILQTHTCYIMGNDNPIEVNEEELLDQAKSDFGEKIDIAVAQAPSDFDPRKRTHYLKIDKKSGTVKIEPVAKLKQKKRG